MKEEGGQKDGKARRGKKEKRKRQRSEAMHESVVTQRKKARKERQQKEVKEAIDTLNRKQGEAKAYLSKWRDDKEHWKFSTVMQNWLIKNAFDRKIIPKTLFSDFLVPYITTMSEKSKQRLLQASDEIIQTVEKDGRSLAQRVEALEKKASGSAEVQRKIKILRARYKRARTLHSQLLTNQDDVVKEESE